MSAASFEALFADPSFHQILREVADEVAQRRGIAHALACDAVAWAIGDEQILDLIDQTLASDTAGESSWPLIKTILRRYVMLYVSAAPPPGVSPRMSGPVALIVAGGSPRDPADHGDHGVHAAGERGDEAGADRGEHEPVAGARPAGGGARLEEGDVAEVGAERDVGKVADDRHEPDR
jgi:hypothetical protein